ncbi:hypothetical protein M3212_20695 [Alkalihalobacillus oceani]|uniref:hypothetical protein n=1 Tax=Halalkalibacter oceani TaxID=1653776 RepID=UPI002041B7C2|nr:hypothetical protein [Halalkalibacter oceani]MCM3763140.1 hypothetical protein [Halalkalibacter oceani]
MQQFSYVGKSLIVLLSEAVWIYYLIVLFTSIEWGSAASFHVSWWLAAACLGYLMTKVLSGRVHYLAVIAVQLPLLLIIVWQNWLTAVPEDGWVLGIALSLALLFLYVRSGSFVFFEPKRPHMLRRFEGNIIFYVVFAWIFTYNGWATEIFHLLFLASIFLSLLGMVTTLQSDTDSAAQEVEVRTVGQSRWFHGVLSVFVLSISLLCFILFLPVFRNGLYALALTGWGWLTEAGALALKGLQWLFSLLPTDTGGEMLPLENNEMPLLPEEAMEEMPFNLPVQWIVIGVGSVVAILALLVVARFLKGWQPPKGGKPRKLRVTRISLWDKLVSTIQACLQRLSRRWRASIRRYYLHSAYWTYAQVHKWGRKNGLKRQKTETAKEYIERMIARLSEEQTVENDADRRKQAQLLGLLRQLYREYDAVYYGGEINENETNYAPLLDMLNGVTLKKRRVSGKSAVRNNEM